MSEPACTRLQDRRRCLPAAALVLAATASAQGPELRAVVDREWRIEVAHGQLGGPRSDAVPAGTDLGTASVRTLQTAAGFCTASSQIVVNGNPRSLTVVATVSCTLLARLSGQPAAGRSSGELLLTLSSPVVLDGTLLVAIDTRGSSGTTTLGEMFVDIGDDGVGEYGHGGQNPTRVEREFTCRATPQGTKVRIAHLGFITADDTRDARFFAELRLRFMPGTSPVVPHLEGCRRLGYGRTFTGIAFDFGGAAIPHGNSYFLAVGTPLPTLLRQTECGPIIDIVAVRMLTSPRVLFPNPALAGLGSAIVQGFVFSADGLEGTDSWRIH
jgi:hypothetical protein